VYFTASGIPIIYFNGIAIPNNKRKDIPSAVPIALNFLIIAASLISDQIFVKIRGRGDKGENGERGER
jgi:hypothetical protein